MDGRGPVPEVLHRALIAGVERAPPPLPSLTFLAPLFFRAINTIRWGEHLGGMFVALDGASADGTAVSRSWHLLAEGDDGPLIPSMAVEAIVRKCLSGAPPPSGARSAVADLELCDYDALFARRAISHGFRDVSAEAANVPLYRRLLGTAFDRLPPPIRDMHAVGGTRVATGTTHVERGRNPVSKLIGWLFRFPPAGHDMPLRVRFTPDGGGSGQRIFGERVFQPPDSRDGSRRQTAGRNLRPFAFALALGAPKTGFPWSCGTGVSLAAALALSTFGDAFESVRDDKFHFNVEIRMPIVGLIVRYRGSLMPQRLAAQHRRRQVRPLCP